MDMYTLYGETVASFLLHGAMVVIASLIAAPFWRGSDGSRLQFFVVFAASVAIGSALINGGLLTILHQLTCSGVKNVSGILKGVGISAVLSGVFALLPFFITPLRLLISQMLIPHRFLGTAERKEAETILLSAAEKVHALDLGAAGAASAAEAETTVGSISPSLFEQQTFQEGRVAAAYMAAFAGAYGMAIGAHWCSVCG